MEHERHLDSVLQTLRQHQLYAKLEKCEFWLSRVGFLGHVVSADSIYVDSQKVEAVANWEQPTTVTEVRIPRISGVLPQIHRRVLKDSRTTSLFD